MESTKKDDKYQAIKNISNTDEALKLYSETQEPNFADYYRPSENQKMGEMLYVGGGMLALGYMSSKLF